MSTSEKTTPSTASREDGELEATRLYITERRFGGATRCWGVGWVRQHGKVKVGKTRLAFDLRLELGGGGSGLDVMAGGFALEAVWDTRVR